MIEEASVDSERPLAEVRELHPATVNTDTDQFPAVTDEIEDEPEDEPGPDFSRSVTVTAMPMPVPAPPRTEIRMKPVPVEPVKQDAEPADETETPKASRTTLVGLLLGEKIEAEVPKSAVVTAGVFLVPVAVIAFALSFQITLPLIKAGGWSGTVALMGPLLLDAAATAAAIFGTLSRHYLFVRSGRLLLILATVLSVWLNMDGHAFYAKQHPGSGESLAMIAYSIAVPIILAILIHLFGTALGVYLEQKQEQERREKAEAERAERERLEAERKRAAEAKAASERKALADAAQAEQDARIAALPKPKRGEVASKQVGIAYGIAYQAATFAPLRDVLKDAGYKLPASETTIKNWLPEIRKELGLA
ncbi:hypothetical protein ABT324_28025 [Saccharopolyspora sp. NPDC000359]|uniref:hypothetical protein n=1 Tax=Saccharopolyspora sp. NPDC000359 TaxID=3154251 RepID=UPI00331E2F49